MLGNFLLNYNDTAIEKNIHFLQKLFCKIIKISLFYNSKYLQGKYLTNIYKSIYDLIKITCSILIKRGPEIL